MDIERLTNEELREEIEKRKEMIKKIAAFIAEFTAANGRIAGDICKWNFFNLKFQIRTIEGIALDASYNEELFFSVWFERRIGNFKDPFAVSVYDTNNSGLTKLEKAMTNPEQPVIQKAAEDAGAEKIQLDKAKLAEERAALIKEAKELKL